MFYFFAIISSEKEVCPFPTTRWSITNYYLLTIFVSAYSLTGRNRIGDERVEGLLSEVSITNLLGWLMMINCLNCAGLRKSIL